MGSESSSLDEQRYGAGPLCRCGHQFGDHAYYSDRSLGERCVWSACACTAFRPDSSVTEEEAASLLSEDLQDMEASAPPEADEDLERWPCGDCGAMVPCGQGWCPACPEPSETAEETLRRSRPSRRPPYAVAYSVDGGHLYEVMVPGDATCIAEDGVIKIQHHGHYVLGLLRVQPVNLNEESDAEADHR